MFVKYSAMLNLRIVLSIDEENFSIDFCKFFLFFLVIEKATHVVKGFFSMTRESYNFSNYSDIFIFSFFPPYLDIITVDMCMVYLIFALFFSGKLVQWITCGSSMCQAWVRFPKVLWTIFP